MEKYAHTNLKKTRKRCKSNNLVILYSDIELLDGSMLTLISSKSLDIHLRLNFPTGVPYLIVSSPHTGLKFIWIGTMLGLIQMIQQVT